MKGRIRIKENKQINILSLQETLPEEAAGHNPLLPAVPQQEETSPTSKVTFFSQNPIVLLFPEEMSMFPTFTLDEGKKLQLLSATSVVTSNDHASCFCRVKSTLVGIPITRDVTTNFSSSSWT